MDRRERIQPRTLRMAILSDNPFREGLLWLRKWGWQVLWTVCAVGPDRLQRDGWVQYGNAFVGMLSNRVEVAWSKPGESAFKQIEIVGPSQIAGGNRLEGLARSAANSNFCGYGYEDGQKSQGHHKPPHGILERHDPCISELFENKVRDVEGEIDQE